MEPKWNQSGTKVEPKWNQSGTKVEPKWNQSGTKVEQDIRICEEMLSRMRLEVMRIYPLVICYIAIENGPVEIVHLPSYNMVIFHSFLYVYQRVSAIKSH